MKVDYSSARARAGISHSSNARVGALLLKSKLSAKTMIVIVGTKNIIQEEPALFL